MLEKTVASGSLDVLDQHRSVLLRVLHAGNGPQVKALDSLSQLAQAKSLDAKFVDALFRKLYELDLVFEPAFKEWRALPGTERNFATIVQHTADFFQFLRDTPQDDDL